MPDDCVYQCLVFDGNAFLKHNSVCAGYMQKIIHQEILVYHHFTDESKDICETVNSIFDSMWQNQLVMNLLFLDNFTTFLVSFLVNITIWKMCKRHEKTIRGFSS